MPQQGFLALAHRGDIDGLAPAAHHLVEVAVDPGITQAAAADHDPVAARDIEEAPRVEGRKNVAVADDRDFNRALDLADRLPIRLAGVLLGLRAAVHGDRVEARGLGALGEPRLRRRRGL